MWFGALQCKKDMDILEQAQQRPLRWLVAVVHNIQGEAERAECVQDGEETVKEDLTALCSYLMSQVHEDLLAGQGQPTTERTRSSRNRSFKKGNSNYIFRKSFSP